MDKICWVEGQFSALWSWLCWCLFHTFPFPFLSTFQTDLDKSDTILGIFNLVYFLKLSFIIFRTDELHCVWLITLAFILLHQICTSTRLSFVSVKCIQYIIMTVSWNILCVVLFEMTIIYLRVISYLWCTCKIIFMKSQ